MAGEPTRPQLLVVFRHAPLLGGVPLCFLLPSESWPDCHNRQGGDRSDQPRRCALPGKIAEQLFRHLRRIEQDSHSNVPTPGQPLPFYHVQVRHYAGGRTGGYIRIHYNSHEPEQRLTRAQAEAYLAWLDTGHRGSYDTDAQSCVRASPHVWDDSSTDSSK